jgi:short-subunit dehydrogenase
LRLGIFLLYFLLLYNRPMPSPNFFQSKSVLITGASSGIGAELAAQLARLGARLTLTARRGKLLDDLAQKILADGHAAALVVECDVTHDGDVDHAVAECLAKHGRLDVVIANAGFGVVGFLRTLTVEDYRRQFETNVFGVLRTIYATLPALEQSKGNLVIIGSVAGWAASPGASPYAMSKFALRALANAVTPELRMDGISVTLISPGFVASDIRRTDNRGTVHPGAKDPIPEWLMLDTPTAARQILRAVARGKREAIITSHGKGLVFLERFMPWVIRLAGKRMARSRGGYRSEPKAT